jgi:GDSL-like Lipase/Acylhydrolase family
MTLLLVACGTDPALDALDAGVPDSGAADAPAPDAPALIRYPTEGIRSPITPAVTARLRAIAAVDPTRDAHAFIKIGASGTVSSHFLHCLPTAGVDSPSIAWFLPWFTRVSLAASVGKSAVWALAGDPSPVEQEIAAANPRYAFVNYGTNDMGLGASFDRSLVAFHENLSRLLDHLEDAGIVPLISGLNPRADDPSYAAWVPTFDAVTRAMAEARALPYLSLYTASSPLPGLGLVADGIHGNASPEGACVFTADGLAFNYNVRNLESLRLLDVARRAVAGEAFAEAALPPIAGRGTHADPFVVDRLPFAHAGDTRGGEAAWNGYPACDDGQDESGPEIVYRLDLAAETPVRVVVLDRTDVDVDAHVLLGDDPADCVARHDRVLDTTLPAGEARVVVDTFGDDAGRYLLVVLEP